MTLEPYSYETVGIFESYRRSYEEAYRKALEGAKYLYEQGAKKVFLFGSITKPELFMRKSDIDIAVSGLPEEKRLSVEAKLIDILFPYDFALVVIDSKPKCCIKSEANMLKNPAKATGFYSDSRDRTFNVWCILKKGWLTRLKGYKVSLVGIFHHICPTS